VGGKRRNAGHDIAYDVALDDEDNAISPICERWIPVIFGDDTITLSSNTLIFYWQNATAVEYGQWLSVSGGESGKCLWNCSGRPANNM